MRRRSDTLFSVPTLEYLQRGGRIGRAQALVGTLLGVRPLLAIEDGAVVPAGKVRGAERVLPALDGFAPELILVSAGFDAHHRDPLAAIDLETEDYGWATTAIAEVAARHAGGRLVSSLEGGYDLVALGESAAAHVTALMAA